MAFRVLLERLAPVERAGFASSASTRPSSSSTARRIAVRASLPLSMSNGRTASARLSSARRQPTKVAAREARNRRPRSAGRNAINVIVSSQAGWLAATM